MPCPREQFPAVDFFLILDSFTPHRRETKENTQEIEREEFTTERSKVMISRSTLTGLGWFWLLANFLRERSHAVIWPPGHRVWFVRTCGRWCCVGLDERTPICRGTYVVVGSLGSSFRFMVVGFRSGSVIPPSFQSFFNLFLAFLIEILCIKTRCSSCNAFSQGCIIVNCLFLFRPPFYELNRVSVSGSELGSSYWRNEKIEEKVLNKRIKYCVPFASPVGLRVYGCWWS